MKEVGRTCQERGQRPSSETGTILSVDTHRSRVLSCRLLTTLAGQSSLGAQHARGRRRPLRPEGLATLALRTLNRQPAGVLALHWTTCRLHHHHGVRTLVKPVGKKRQVEVSQCMQKQTDTGESPRPHRPARPRWRATLAGLPHAAYARGRQRGEIPATPAPRIRINKQLLCHSVAAGRDGQPRFHAVQKLPDPLPTRH